MALRCWHRGMRLRPSGSRTLLKSCAGSVVEAIPFSTSLHFYFTSTRNVYKRHCDVVAIND
jgi:hypothetical protein